MDSVASRYAIALLSIAREENKVSDYVKQAEELVQIFKDNKELSLLLKDYGLTNEEKKETLDVCFKGKIYEYILNLLYVLIDNKRGGYIQEVLSEFARIGLNELNIKRGIVTTTIKLTKDELSKMEKKISKMLNANVTLQNVIDPSIVGGFKIQVDDYIIDDTMVNRLYKLKDNISKKKGEND